VRHKALDAIGDLALAGLPLVGAYRSVRGGHKLNHAVLSALMADKSAWTLVEADTVRPGRGHADVATGHVAVAYAPDVSCPGIRSQGSAISSWWGWSLADHRILSTDVWSRHIPGGLS